MSEFESTDIDGDRMEIQRRADTATPGTEFWVHVAGGSTAVSRAHWLSLAKARELRDWLSEQLGDKVVATHDGNFYKVPSEHAEPLHRWLGEILAQIAPEPDPAATQPIDPGFLAAIAEAQARLANAKHARQILSSAGPFGDRQPRVADIIALAEWLGKNEDGAFVGVLDDEEAKA